MNGEQPQGPPATDQARALVEQAVARLADADRSPVGEHVTVLDEVHRSLQDALATLDGV